MENNNNQQSFYQFSDQLRIHTPNLANLSLNDSIWSSSYGGGVVGVKKTEERKNFDIRVGGQINSSPSSMLPNDLMITPQYQKESSDFNNGYSNNNNFSNDGWKIGSNLGTDGSNFLDQHHHQNKNTGVNGGLIKGIYSSPSSLLPNDLMITPQYQKESSDFTNGYSNNNNFSNDGWKIGSNLGTVGSNFLDHQHHHQNKNTAVNGGFNKGIYSKPSINYNNYNNDVNLKGYGNNVNFKGGYGKNKVSGDDDLGQFNGGKNGRKNNNYNKNNNNNNNNNGDNNNNNKNSVDKRFKTLPPAESLPRNETIGGYIFVCNNDTMQENLKRELFGLPPRYRDSVRAITPGLPLFLYNYSTHQLHGVFEASSFGGSNIDPTAWEDKKLSGESRFPAQVRVVTRKICEPLEEDSFRPILHHYDGPKFRLELSIPEVISLLDVLEEATA